MKVFVYGTLKSHHSNSGYLAESKFLGDYFARDMHLINTIGFPYAYEEEGLEAIGELYEVDKATMRSLDRLEGYPDHYDRKEVTVQPFLDILVKSKAEKAWIYYLPKTSPYIKRLKEEYGTTYEWTREGGTSFVS